MFKRILVANRGEIALRILRACREMGIETVAVYSEADKGANYLRAADDAICIGPPRSAASYLDIPRIMSAAEIADVEAIHPGYGFLAENAHFADVCRSCKIQFIGPPAEVIALFGNKSRAKEVARDAKVPVIPGSEGVVHTEGEAVDLIDKEIGYPVMIKASSGGGGRGMRVARNEVSLINGFLSARTEAEAAFGDPSVYLERLVENARHIEVQVLADGHGNVISLGERDCSVQRRHQKLIEEAPSSAVTPELRAAMGEAARGLCTSSGYENAGTVEFLLDAKGFYFMEMNARIQVEHPVTEEVTGIDLIKAQINIAAGEKLPWTQDDVRIQGHSIECRINAEDPAHGFRPCPGTITQWIPPGGKNVRLDTHAHADYRIPSHYDSMIAKLIVRGADRAEAITIMTRALDEFRVGGVKTTIPVQREILRSEKFRSGNFDTSLVETLLSG